MVFLWRQSFSCTCCSQDRRFVPPRSARVEGAGDSRGSEGQGRSHREATERRDEGRG